MKYPIKYKEVPVAPKPSRVEQSNLIGEWQTVFQLPRLFFQLPKLWRVPKGKKQLIFLIPGWKSPELSMEPLRLFLKSKGYDSRHWGLGVNKGHVQKYTDDMVDKISKLKLVKNRDIILIGWSLGGVIAREVARDLSSIVTKVITYGSPIVGGPTYTIGVNSYSEAERTRISQLTYERSIANPLEMPVVTIFTKNDNIVSWPACIDYTSKHVTHYEVGSTHVGLGIDPDVWQIITQEINVI